MDILRPEKATGLINEVNGEGVQASTSFVCNKTGLGKIPAMERFHSEQFFVSLDFVSEWTSCFILLLKMYIAVV
jgi:hypothetical protein